MTCTTIDIKDLKRVKREALDRGMTLKELVNRAVEEYLRKKPERPADSPSGPTAARKSAG